MWLCLPLGNLWIRIGIFTQLWYIKCCRFNCICENFSLKSILKVSRFYESDEAVSVTHMFGQLLQKCWNLGLAGLSATALCCYLNGKLGSWIRLPPLPPFSLRKYLGYNLGVVSLCVLGTSWSDFPKQPRYLSSSSLKANIWIFQIAFSQRIAPVRKIFVCFF